MFLIDDLTTYELGRRMDSLPQSLASSLASEDTNHIVESICKDRHLADLDKITAIKQLVALVVMGFIHPSDLPAEINSQLALDNLKLSADIAAALDAKIFSSIRVEIDANYSPKMEVNEIDKLVDLFDSLGIEVAPSPVTAKEPKKNPFDSIVLTKSVAVVPTTKSAAPRPLGTFSIAPTPAVAPAPIKEISPLSTFGRTVAPSPASASSSPQKKSIPTPFIIHGENNEPQIIRAPKFKFEASSSSGSAFGSVGRAPSSMQPPKPAQIEIGREEKLKPVEKIAYFGSAPKTIHYSSLSSPITMSGSPTNPVTAQSSPFGNLAPMPASPAGGPSFPSKPVSPTPTPAFPRKIEVKNPLVGNAAPVDSFGGLVKNMISPEKKILAVPAAPVPPPPPAR